MSLAGVESLDDFFDFGPTAPPCVSDDSQPYHPEHGTLADTHLPSNDADYHTTSLSIIESTNYAQAPFANTSRPDASANFQTYLSSYHKPLVPCQYCSTRQLDCKLFVNDGNQQCFACISLFRTCSFVSPQENPGVCIDTLHSVNEDAAQELGLPTGIHPSYTAGASHFDIQNDDGRAEKRSEKSGRFSRDVLQILRGWMYSHSEDPYPTDEEKDDLKQKTGLTRNQVSNWLANARRRGQVKPKRCASPSVRSRAQPIDIGNLASASQADKSHLTPFERWKDSPPENEAPITVLAREAEATQFQHESNNSSTAHSQHRSSGGSALSRLRAPSVSSETGRSSGSTKTLSAWSHGSSQGSYGSFAKKDRRRRRRSGIVPPNARSSSKLPSTARPFQCTFCVDTFRTKYDWTRHEKSMHLNLEKWICAPHGGIDHCSVRNIPVCSYCRIADPTPEHVEEHNHTVCASKDIMSRTFLRKDHLRQHLRLVHDVDMLRCMDRWKTVPSEVRSRCGFCNAQFKTWDERASHLSGHFHNGATMAEWKEGWGFEPEVAQCVSDAMPPWLIHLERSKPLPWSASTGDTTMYDAIKATHAPAPEVQDWEILTAGLAEYVQRCRREGRVVTDTNLQDYARQCLYGSDDKWNQTRADDEQWLWLFKQQQGLISGSGGNSSQKSMEVGKINEITCATLGADLGPRLDPLLPAKQQTAFSWDNDGLQGLDVDMGMSDMEGALFDFS